MGRLDRASEGQEALCSALVAAKSGIICIAVVRASGGIIVFSERWWSGKSRRWLQDTSKRKLAEYYFLWRPPLPISPGSPEIDPMIRANPGFARNRQARAG